MVQEQKTKSKNESCDHDELTAGERVLRRLSNEHVYLSTLLDALTVQTKALGPGGKPDYYTIRDIVDYLVNFPDQHHHPMEDAVYEKLRKNHHGSTSMVVELLAEHNDMAIATRSLKELLDGACAGQPKIKRPLLQARLEEYLQLYSAHINTEESKTFPMAAKHLKESDWLEIENSMQTPEDPIFGERVARRYHKVVSALESVNDELAEDIAIVEWLGTQAILDSGGVLIDGAVQSIDVLKHHAGKSWQEALELIKSTQQPEAVNTISDLPGLIIRNNIKRCREYLRHSSKIHKNVNESLRESWSWERGALGKLMSRDRNKRIH